MKNPEVAAVLERIADLLEIDGADRFRVNSYRKAARNVDDCAEDVAVLAAEGRLGEIDGVGKGTADRIKSYLDSGTIDVLAELEAKMPPGLPALLGIPGIGPKKVSLAWKELGVGSIDDLRAVIADGRLAGLQGMGKASVAKIAEGLAFLESSGGRTPLGVAMPIAEAFAELVRGIPGVSRVELAGSLRRGQETIGDIDILCIAKDAESAVREFTSSPQAKRVLASGETKGSITVDGGGGKELQIDLRAVPPESFGAAWQYFTGSKDHNVRIREMAVKKKWRLNEYGLFDGDKQIAGETEESIYKRLGLRCPPPEMRQDRHEFDFEGEFDELVTIDDIVSDLHMHTTASDGRHSIEEMAEAAKARGYTHIAICDHSVSATIANGLSIERMEAHIDAIRTANGKVKGIEILVGTECDILPDARMDYPDKILKQCDWVVASIHSAMGKATGKGKKTPTERTLAAIENRWVCCIGHPTGRLINQREAMEMDMAAVIAAAAENGTMLEINAHHARLDLKDLHAHQAIAAGVMLSINTDAHSVDGFNQLRYGILTARRAGARKRDVANCLSLAALRERVAHKRG